MFTFTSKLRCCKCHFFAPSPWWQTTLRRAMHESTWNAKPQPLTVTAKKSKASLVFGGSIHQGTNAGSLNELLDVGHGIRAQEGFLRSQNTKGRCQPSNLSLLRTIARCLHRNHPVIFNPETNGDEKKIMMIHNAIMLSTCNLFQKPRHIHKTSAPDRPWHCKTLAGAKPCKASGDCYDCYDCDVFHFNRDVVVSPGPQAQQEICSSMHEALRREESLGSHTGLCMEATWAIWDQFATWKVMRFHVQYCRSPTPPFVNCPNISR